MLGQNCFSCKLVIHEQYFISHTEIVQEHIHLIDLEAHGLAVSGNVIKVWLICVLGDNLGSYWLGGFSTNFSCNSYICRYCLVQSQFSADCWTAYPWQLCFCTCFCEWFTHFNRFNYLETDANDKPSHVAEGKAIWRTCLSDLVSDTFVASFCVQNPVWQLCIMLREIEELACAPKICLEQICLLNRLVQQYIEEIFYMFASVPSTITCFTTLG